MPIRVYRIKYNESLIGNRQSATRYKFTNSYELATGNCQPDGYSISEDFRQFEVISKPANDSQMTICTFFMNWQLAARCQFESRGFKTILGK